MSCFHSKYGFLIRDNLSGKQKMQVVCRDVQKTWMHDADGFFKSVRLRDDIVPDGFSLVEPARMISFPCGQCIGCRLDYSRQWADRIVMESMSYPGRSWFLTLTYADECLPVSDLGSFTLYPRDIELFLKRFRRSFGDGIRFFLAGEYGDQSARPHYHLCVMNVSFHDLKYYKANEQGDLLFTSEKVESVWNKGYVVIAPLSWQTAAYTARYVIKKQKGKNAAAFYAEKGLFPEFCRMSRRPGLAADFFSKNVGKIYSTGDDGLSFQSSVVLPATNRRSPHIASAPRYFDKLLEKIDPEFLELFKRHREALGYSRHAEERLVHGGFEADFFRLKEQDQRDRSKALRRIL